MNIMKDIYLEKIIPLIDKNIIIETKNTKSYINTNMPNKFLQINPKVIDIDKEKIKHLDLRM